MNGSHSYLKEKKKRIIYLDMGFKTSQYRVQATRVMQLSMNREAESHSL